MKSYFRRMGSLLLLLTVLSLCLTSCFWNRPKSAYELAVSQGFSGTEEEWIASLQGQDLNIRDIYAAAQSEGYEGSFLEFLFEYLSLDPDMLAEAILGYQEKTLSQSIARSLLCSVNVQCSSSASGVNVSPSAGSGVIYQMDRDQGDAYIITNYHVVSYNTGYTTGIHSSIYVFLYGYDVDNDNAIRATYVGGSATYDLAVLKVDASEILRDSSATILEAANSEDVCVGLDVVAIGNSAGGGINATTGIVSLDSKIINLRTDNHPHRMIQISAAVNEGNSGGGLFDAQGRLIGIVTAKMEAEYVENIGFAIPANIAVRVANSLINAYEEENGSSLVSKSVSLSVASIGLEVEGKNTAAYYDADDGVTRIREDVTVSAVSSGSLAKNAGLKKGDVITSVAVDGQVISVDRTFSFEDALLLCRTGSYVKITYLRNGNPFVTDLTVTAGCMRTLD